MTERNTIITYRSIHSNSLSSRMGNSLLAVRVINHKYIVVERTDLFESSKRRKKQLRAAFSCAPRHLSGRHRRSRFRHYIKHKDPVRRFSYHLHAILRQRADRHSSGRSDLYLLRHLYFSAVCFTQKGI